MMNMLTQTIAAMGHQQASTPPTPAPTTLATPSIKEPKIKDPDTFDGKRDALNGFLTECELVFALQPSRFADDLTKVNYMTSLLRGMPLQAIRPHILASPKPAFLLSIDEFIAYLKTNYGDPDEKGTARRKLKALRQTGSASAYFAEVQQYLAVLGWKDEDSNIDRAIEGLKPNLKDEIARTGNTFTTLTSLIKFIIPLDNRLHERQQERNWETKIDTRSDRTSITSITPKSTSTTYTSTTRSSAPARAEPPRTTVSSSMRPSSTIPSRATTPYESRQRGPLSGNQRQYRVDNKLCLYCGSAGHTVNICPVAANKNMAPSSLSSTTVKSEPSNSKNA